MVRWVEFTVNRSMVAPHWILDKENGLQIETVTGPIPAEELGATLMHEHVTALVPGGFFSGGRRDDAVDMAERALACLLDHGISTVIDLTGRSRIERLADITLLQSISKRTGLRIVAGFGLYKEKFSHEVSRAEVGELTDLFVHQALEGIDGSDVRAGIYGEVGTSLDTITPIEERCLRAVARAHRVTALAISTHCTLGTMACEQVSILAEEGADLSRVVIGHLDLESDLSKVEAVLRMGANVAFDTFGKEWFDYRVSEAEAPRAAEFVKWTYHRADADRLEALTELVNRGYDQQIVLSSDISGREAYMNPTTHGALGYAYIPERILPALRAAGMGEASIHRMLIDNPARVLGS